MTFIDITVVPVSTDRKKAYLEFAGRMAEVYREYGALRVADCWQSEDASGGKDFHAEEALTNYLSGDLPDFRRLAGAADSETVVVSLTEWPSREVRDRGVKAATHDPRVLATLDEEPVFDGGRLVAGGFTVEFDLR